MKFRVTTLGLLLLMTTSIFGQEKITEKKYQTFNADKGEWEIQDLEQTKYDEEEREVLWNRFYRTSSDSLINWERVENIYSAENRQEIHYGRRNQMLSPESIETWEYNEEGCIATRTFRALEGGEGHNDNLNKSTFTFMENAPPCTIEEEIFSVFVPEIQTDFVKNAKYIYSYEDDFKTVVMEKFIWQESNQVWSPLLTQETGYNEAGQKILERTTYEVGTAEEFLWEYDNLGNVIADEKNYYQDDILTEHSRVTYVYEFDENNFVIKRTSQRNNGVIFQTYDYENYCDGLHQIQKEFHDFSLSNCETHFKYLHGTACEIFEEKLNLLLYPNPTNGILNLESDLLTTASAQVEIFNMAGQQLRVFDMPQRTNIVEIGVDDLPVGSYVVRVISDKNSVTEKLIISPF